MATRVVLRPHQLRSPGTLWALRGKWGISLQILVLLTIVSCITWGLFQWYKVKHFKLVNTHLGPLCQALVDALEQRLHTPPAFPTFHKGDEPELLQAMLHAPTLQAVMEEGGAARIWIRQGNRLVLAADAQASRYHALPQPALQQRDHKTPWVARVSNGDTAAQTLVTLCKDSRFTYIREITAASQALEDELRLLLGPSPQLLVNFTIWEDDWDQAELATSAHQISQARAFQNRFYTWEWIETPKVRWCWLCVPGPTLSRSLTLRLAWECALPFLSLGCLGALLMGWLALRRRKIRLLQNTNARLAKLFLDLEAPIATLQRRCQSVREGKFSRDALDAHLIRISEDVERLSLWVENGLKAILGRGPTKAGSAITRDWLAAIAEDYDAAFEQSGRAFWTELDESALSVDLESLRQVLQAMLDNALTHGNGPVTLRHQSSQDRAFIEVCDEHNSTCEQYLQKHLILPHHEAGDVDGVSPKTRLHHALQIAEREGWGMAVTSGPGGRCSIRIDLIKTIPISLPPLASPLRSFMTSIWRRHTARQVTVRANHTPAPVMLFRQLLEPQSRVAHQESLDVSRTRRWLLIPLVLIAALSFVSLTHWGLRRWHQVCCDHVTSHWLDPHFQLFNKMFRERWSTSPPLPTFSQGTEPEVRAFLMMHPLITAVVRHPTHPEVWERTEDGCLARAGDRSRAFSRKLADAFWRQTDPHWTPTDLGQPDPEGCFTILSGNPDMVFIRRACPGSRDLDEEMTQIMGIAPEIRIGIRAADGSDARPPRALPPDTQQQVFFTWQQHPYLGTIYYPIQVPYGMAFSVAPIGALETTMRWAYWGAMSLALIPPLLIVGFLLLHFALWQHEQRQALLDGKRLASFTHSLQTPLAILRARCDSLRFQRIPPQEIALEQQKIGVEINDLTRSLAPPIDPNPVISSRLEDGIVSQAWLDAQATAFRPLLGQSGRNLTTKFTSEDVRVSLNSLQQILRTILENALKYGGGHVFFSTWNINRRLYIEIRDQGPGMDRLALEQLGQPMRADDEGASASAHHGLGLGLNLAIAIAKAEGWGLVFSSEPGQGLAVRIEIPVVG